MKVIVMDIPDEGMHIAIDMALKAEGIETKGPVRGHIELQRSGTEVIVSGKAKVDIGLQCGLCLSEFISELPLDLNLLYAPEGEPVSEDSVELSTGEMDVCQYSEGEIDIAQMLREQVILNVSISAVCSDNCRGLCPVCGINLNTETCNCKNTSGEGRFFKLKDLLTKTN
ncbi:MAG: DUF177 domain-containing protein [Nitrospirae bacterium]|nr:DUF177 domain-containing protein [Nitrospirota bacterium]MBF0535011.1 DUF177 domain-containing protein [Nitrospirota bacterium]MBF0616519.1 DUF177 domain-containing protein [Nitrospirota bacterium]